MHRTRNADDAGAAPAGGSIFQNGDHIVKAESGSVKAVVWVRIPLVSPFSSRTCRSRRGGRLQPVSYPVQMHRAKAHPINADALSACRWSGYPGCASNFKPTQLCPGTRKTAIRAVRIGETLGAAPRCPTIYTFRQGVGSDAPRR